MGLSIGDAVGGFAHAFGDLAEAGIALGSQAASMASWANPATMALGVTKSLTGGADVTSKIMQNFLEQQETVRGHRKQGRGEKGGCHGGSGGCEGTEGGGSIFEQIALALGEAMDKKLGQLLKAANEVASLSGGQGDQGKLLTASAQVTARGQELNAISQAANSAINSLGNAVSTAASKR